MKIDALRPTELAVSQGVVTQRLQVPCLLVALGLQVPVAVARALTPALMGRTTWALADDCTCKMVHANAQRTAIALSQFCGDLTLRRADRLRRQLAATGEVEIS